MNYSILTLLATSALMLAMMLTLILKPKMLRKFNGFAVCFAGIVGLIFYGLGYGTEIHSFSEIFIVAIQAVDDTISMFTGKDAYSSLLSSAPWFANHMWMQVFYWLAVLAAMYFTAAVVLGALGKRFLRFLRGCIITWRKQIVLFYNITDDQLNLAKKICEKGSVYPVFIGDCKTDKVQEKLDEIAAIVWDEDFITEDGKWLAKLGLSKDSAKTITLFAAGNTDAQTRKFLRKTIKALDNLSLSSRVLTITVLCDDEQEFAFLTERQKDGLYLSADICSYKNLAAKVLVKNVPPWDLVSFDEKGVAKDNFHAMIIGFGQVGQSVLCELLRNSQFIGQKTRIQVIDNKYKEKAGAFLAIYESMLTSYDIEFVELDAFSAEFFKLLYKERNTLDYTVICMGDDEKNQEAASQIRFFHNRKNMDFRKDMVIASCSKKEVLFYDNPDLSIRIPDAKALWSGTLAKDAKAIHRVYMTAKAQALFPGQPEKQQRFYEDSWYENSYSSRLSCDASATFIPAMYKAAGIDPDDNDRKMKMQQALDSCPALLENLSQMEHLRWNAFSYSMGVAPMPIDEFKARVERALIDIHDDAAALALMNVDKPAENQTALDRIHWACRYVRKELEDDGFGGIHVCLTDWDTLDVAWEIYRPLAEAVAKAEHDYALTFWTASGKKTAEPQREILSTFKQLDTNNICDLMEKL